jgi:F0F1-type ATP synthase assembly protein I
MTQQNPQSASDEEPQKGDPWHAFGYLVSGVAFYGLLGWLVDRWLGTSFLVVLGILLGAGLGLYLTFARFNRQKAPPNQQEKN